MDHWNQCWNEGVPVMRHIGFARRLQKHPVTYTLMHCNGAIEPMQCNAMVGGGERWPVCAILGDAGNRFWTRTGNDKMGTSEHLNMGTQDQNNDKQ